MTNTKTGCGGCKHWKRVFDHSFGSCTAPIPSSVKADGQRDYIWDHEGTDCPVWHPKPPPEVDEE